MPGLNFPQQVLMTMARNRILVNGSWDCNTAANPASLQGDLFKLGTVVLTSTGLFTFTFTLQKPGKILDAHAELRGNVTAGDFVCVDSFSSTAGTVLVRTKDAGGQTNITAAENIRVSLWVWLGRMQSPIND